MPAPAWQLSGVILYCFLKCLEFVFSLSPFLKMASQSGAHAGLELGIPLPQPPWYWGLQVPATTYGLHYFLNTKINAYIVFTGVQNGFPRSDQPFSCGPGSQDLSAMEQLLPSGTLLGPRGFLYLPSQTQHLCSLGATCQSFEILQKMNPRNGRGRSYHFEGIQEDYGRG